MAKDQVAEVTAMTFASDEYDREPQQVRGKLTKRRVTVLGYTQHLVNGTPVNPSTIKPVEPDEDEEDDEEED